MLQFENSVADRRQRLAADQATVAKVKQRLVSGHKQSAYELQSLIERLSGGSLKICICWGVRK